MTKFGRLESQRLIVPAGGWVAAINDGAAFNATVPAGTYSPTTLATEFEAQCEAGSGQTYSFTLASGEGGSGVFAMTCTAAYTVTWTSTDLRDALGFTGNLGAATTQTGTYGVKGLWLPDCPMQAPYRRGDSGHMEGGPTQTVSPLGVTKTIVRPTRVRLPPVRWSHVTAARARQEAESTARSFERFLRETMFGAVSYFTPGGVTRLIWDADVPATYTDYHPIAPRTTALDRVDANWAGLYACQFEGWAA